MRSCVIFLSLIDLFIVNNNFFIVALPSWAIVMIPDYESISFLAHTLVNPSYERRQYQQNQPFGHCRTSMQLKNQGFSI